MTTIYSKISVYSKLTQSSTSIAEVSIQKALVSIKFGELNLDGTLINLADLVTEARKAGKGSARYEYLKKNSLPCVTWASKFSTGRNKETGYTFSNAQYFDIDGIEGDLEEVKRVISTIPCVKAVWLSVSGKGLGGIIYTQGEDKGYFNQFCKLAKDLGYKIDPAVKDVTSRLNVFSYDPKAIIKNEKNVTVLTEVAEDEVTKFSSSINTNFEKNVTVVEGSKAHRIAYNYTTKKGLNYVSGERAAFIATYASLMCQFGVTYSDACAEISKVHPDFDAKRAYDIYKRYSYNFGTKSTNPVAYTTKKRTSSRTLTVNQKLSDLGLTKQQVVGKMLVAPTGSGKTYFISSLEGKKVVVVPSQKLSEELANAYNGVCFNQHNKDVRNTDSLIFVTYASYANLVGFININEYDVYLDEAHILTTSASRSFMLNELNNTIDSLVYGKQKSVTLMTATPIQNAHPYLQQFEQLVITSAVKKDKKFAILRTADRVKLLQSVFAKAKTDGKFVAVLLNNTKGLLDSYTNALTNYNLQVFNASKKGEDYFVDLVTTGKVDSNVDGFFATTVIKEGNSFYFDTPKDVVVVVLGKFGAEEIEQFSARFRNSNKTQTVVVRGADYKDNEAYFDAKKEESSVIDAAEFNAKYFNDCKYSLNAYSVKLTKNLNPIAETYTKETDGYFEVDYLLASNVVYEQEKTAAWNNTQFFVEKLAEYGWTFTGVSDFTATLTDDEKKAHTAVNKLSREARQQAMEAIAAQVKTEGLEANKQKVDAANLSPDEAQVRFRLNYIYTYEKDADKVFEVYEEVAQTTQAWNRFERQLSIARVKTDSLTTNRDDRKLIDAIYAEFKVNETLDNAAILSRLNKVLKATNQYKSNDRLTERKANAMLGWFFTVQDNVKKVNGKTVRDYTIKNNSPLPLTINTDKHRKDNEAHYGNYGVKPDADYAIGIFAK